MQKRVITARLRKSLQKTVSERSSVSGLGVMMALFARGQRATAMGNIGSGALGGVTTR
ncbi:hypothetical protein SJI19_08455 [Acerihabitans sp. TG2]|uniref:hypothetical protein n=1 Tax=Acerihabitans sp. TG2 TaxID=3096008 RepID=UPI002B224E36|nr:hypothetical protein [Acerihabitans sp. TG2]MEA9390571.1 hypothetical protein [Acerihabitans sp. TG2]